MKLAQFGTRFVDPEVEHRFRLDSLEDETRPAIAVQATWLLIFVAFTGNDFILFRGQTLAMLLAVRAVMVGTGLAVIWYLQRSRNPRGRDLALMMVVLVDVLGGLLINYVRPPQISAVFATNVVGILTTWALLPMTFRLQALAAVVVTAGAIVIVRFKPGTLHPVEVVRLVVELLLANGIGAGVSVLSHRERRTRWVAIRTSEEAGRALLEAQRELADARVNEIQSRLAQVQRAGGMGSLAVSLAHEIGQPLTAVRNNAFAARAYLERHPPDVERAVEALDDAAEGTERAAAIIQRTRDYLRRSGARQERVEAETIVREAIALVRHDAQRRGVKISAEVAPDAPAVTGDRVQLVQVAIIALVNALDAVDEKPGRRRVVFWVRRDATLLAMGVDDTGPGFAPSQLDRVFEPFFTTKPVGLGMGLSIAREIVEAHGGAIEAGAAPGGGARVSWTIPSVHAAA